MINEEVLNNKFHLLSTHLTINLFLTKYKSLCDDAKLIISFINSMNVVKRSQMKLVLSHKNNFLITVSKERISKSFHLINASLN